MPRPKQRKICKDGRGNKTCQNKRNHTENNLLNLHFNRGPTLASFVYFALFKLHYITFLIKIYIELVAIGAF